MTVTSFHSSIASFCALALLATGCGTSQYNAAMAKRLEDLRREAPFAALSAPTDIPGTSVKISMPKALTRFSTLDTPDPSGPDGKISPDRVLIPQLKLPGVFCVYDADGESIDGSKSPMACQIAIISKATPDVARLATMLETGLKFMFADQKFEWQPVEVDALYGESKIPWKMLHAEGELLWDILPSDPNAEMQFKKLAVLVELWWHESDHYHTLLLWRVPRGVNDRVNLIDLARLSAGTISVGPPPEEVPPANAKPE